MTVRRTAHPLTLFSFIGFSVVVAILGIRPLQIAMLSILLALSLIIDARKKVWTKIGLYVLPVSCLLVAVNTLLGLPIREGTAYALRFALLTIPLFITFYVASPAEFSLGLRTLPIPPRFHYLFLFSFEIVRTLREVFDHVHVAQQLRGYRVERVFYRRWKAVFPLLLPVTLIAITQSLDRSLMLEFRGIDSPGPKTYMRSLPLTVMDRVQIGVLIFASVVTIILRVIAP